MRLVYQQGIGGNGVERMGDGKEVAGSRQRDTSLSIFLGSSNP